jgi:glutathione S-transferase
MSHRFVLHGLQFSGPTYKVGLMLSLCGQPFSYRHIALREGAHKRPEFLARNRFGQVPCLEDTSDGRSFVQSAVILEVLADRLGKFGGEDRWERIEAREWMFWDFDRLAMPIYRARGVRLGFRQAHEATLDMYMTEGKAALGVLEAHLTGRDWMVGASPTIADIDLFGVIDYATAGGHDLATYPAITAWIARLEALPGFGRPMDILPATDRD